jgi:hypothetical protein
MPTRSTRVLVDPEILDSPQSIQLDDLLGDSDSWRWVVRLEAWALEHECFDGVLRVSARRIAKEIGYLREGENLVKALETTRFLEPHPDGFVLIGFAQKYGPKVKQREAAKVRQQRKRERDREPVTRDTPHLSRVTEALVTRDENAAPPTPPTTVVASMIPSSIKININKNSKQRAKTPPARASGETLLAVGQVYEHWRSYHPQAPQHLDTKSDRFRLIRDRLARFTVGQLKLAVDGCHRIPWNLGDNPQRTKYLHLELIMRDDGNVTRFIEVAAQPQLPGLGRELTAREKYLREEAINFLGVDPLAAIPNGRIIEGSHD